MNGDSNDKRYYSKYRGMVINNVDPMKIGRVLVMVPDVFGPGVSSWAVPCLPIGGKQSGMFAVPAIGACVWVEFEGGDSDYPILAGAYWANAAEVPALAQQTPPGMTVVQIGTMTQNQFTISDLPGPSGGFLLTTHSGAMISVSEAGIIIQNGQGASIALLGPTVLINGPALTIT